MLSFRVPVLLYNALGVAALTARLHTPNVLVVEDDEPVRRLIASILEQGGYAVTTARHGAEALAFVRECEPQLILLDVSMPVLDGPSFAREYARITPRPAPVVLLTALSGHEAAGHADRVNAAGFLIKPFEIDDLLDIVGRLIRKDPVIESDPALEALPLPAPLSTPPSTPPAAPFTNGNANGNGSPRRIRPSQTKTDAESDARRRQLRTLSSLVATLRDGLTRSRDDVHALSETGQSRKLTVEESTRLRRLGLESERMRFELQNAWQEFEQLRAGGQVT